MSNRFSVLQRTSEPVPGPVPAFGGDLDLGSAPAPSVKPASESAPKPVVSTSNDAPAPKSVNEKETAAEQAMITVKAKGEASEKMIDVRGKIHHKLIEDLNLVALDRLSRKEVMDEVRDYVGEYAKQERLALNVAETDDLVENIVDEMMGLGPLEPLLADPTISDILINGHENCFVERGGMLQPVKIPFKDEAHLLRIVNKIVSAVGRRIDESYPTCDARMADGSRFNAAIRPNRNRRTFGFDPEIFQEAARPRQACRLRGVDGGNGESFGGRRQCAD